MRLEFFGQSLDEEVNITKTDVPFGIETIFPLCHFWIGASYVLVEGEASHHCLRRRWGEAGKRKRRRMSRTVGGASWSPRLEIYGNLSQAYRPRSYGELIPTAANGVVNPDLEEGHSLQGEIGLRGKPLPYLTFDMSGSGRISKIKSAKSNPNPGTPPPDTLLLTDNVGDARYFGFEAAVEFDILGAINGGAESPWGQLNLYGNVTLLDADSLRPRRRQHTCIRSGLSIQDRRHLSVERHGQSRLPWHDRG